MSHSRAIRWAALAALLFSAELRAWQWPEDPGAYFGPHQACLLVYQAEQLVLHSFNPEQCRVARSPCSTFKIPHSLFALDSGVVDGPDHLMPWDGTDGGRESVNRDHTLSTAVRDSVVWYFQRTARAIGPEQMQEYLDGINYGNRDISGGIDRFWLSSSLRIDAYQQLELLLDLYHLRLPFRRDQQQAVRGMLMQESPLPGQLYGKTGSCRQAAANDGTGQVTDHGWFIGWLEQPGDDLFFVASQVGDQAWGYGARAALLQLLQDGFIEEDASGKAGNSQANPTPLLQQWQPD